MTTGFIGRYEIRGELGRGGMATVYRAYDPNFGRDVALKVLPREFLHDPTFRVRFQREAQTIATLEHSSIVPVYDYGEDDNQPYIVMRLMTGGSLADRLHTGPITLADSARIIEALALALDRAHDSGVIHRDLKPGNILFDTDGHPYLSDFGIAKLAQATTVLTGTGIVGTPAYMSPEQALGEQDLDGRTDIYSLGTIIFQMLTGRLPFESDTPMGMAVKHITEPVPPVRSVAPQLPSQVDPLIEKAMAKRRDGRYQTASDLSKDLSRLAANDNESVVAQTGKLTGTVEVEQPSVPGLKTKSAPRRLARWLVPVVIAAGGLCVLLGVIVVATVRQNTSQKNIVRSTSSAVETGREARSTATATASFTSTPMPTPSLTATKVPTLTEAPTLTPTSASETQGSPPGQTPRMYGYQICLQLCNGTNSVLSAPEATTKLYAQWDYAGIPIGASYVRIWTRDGQEWVRYSCSWPGPAAGTDKVTLTEPGGLHSGTWEMTISVNGQILLRAAIQLMGNWNYWYAAGSFNTCYGKR